MKILCCDVTNDWKSTIISKKQTLWNSTLQNMIFTMLIWKLIHFSFQSILKIITVLNLKLLSLSSRITTGWICVQNSHFYFKLHLQLYYKNKFSFHKMRNQSTNSLILTWMKHLKTAIKKTINILVLVINIFCNQNVIISIWLYDLQILMKTFKFKRKLMFFLLQIHEWQ